MSESIVQILKEARTQKGLSIEQISQLTHIKIRFLEALENDQFDAIPSTAQLKGFLRLYADQVNLPVQPLMNILVGKEPEPVSRVADSLPRVEKAEVKPLEKKKPGIKIPGFLNRNAVPSFSMKNEQPGTPETVSPGHDTQSTTTFKEIGQTIQIRREALGLSLPDIEEYIHVRAFYLKLIEEGKIQELPSLVQARGMLNNYLNFLDLDSETMMLQFADGLQQIHFEKTGNRPLPQKSRGTPFSLPQGWRRLLTTDLILGGAVILIIVGLVIWGAFQVSSLPDTKTNTGSGSISSVLIETSPTVTGTAPVNGIKMGPGEKPAAGPGDQPPSEPTSTLVFTGGGPLQLYIVSNQRAYLRVIVDGKPVFDGRVMPGNAYPFSGNQEIELLTGNAGAFKVSYLQNGTQNDMGILGSIGEVKSLLFTNQGITTPTPKFTVTATGTPQPSPTVEETTAPQQATITPFIPQQ